MITTNLHWTRWPDDIGDEATGLAAEVPVVGTDDRIWAEIEHREDRYAWTVERIQKDDLEADHPELLASGEAWDLAKAKSDAAREIKARTSHSGRVAARSARRA